MPVSEKTTEPVPLLPEQEQPAVIKEETVLTEEYAQPQPETAIEAAGLEEEYQELTAFQAQAEENLEPEMSGLDEDFQADENFGDGTVEVIMEQPPSSAPKMEPDKTTRPAPAKAPDDEPYLGSNQQGLSFL